MPEEARRNFEGMRLRPEGFEAELLRVGFTRAETLREAGTDRGFDRDILVLWK
jgi:hypothetical protein